MTNQLFISTALYLGAMLIASTSVITITLKNEGIYPTLLASIIFAIIALSIPFESVCKMQKAALVMAGVISSLICHFLLSNLVILSR